MVVLSTSARNWGAVRDAPLFSEVKLHDDRVASNNWRCHITYRSRMTLDRGLLLFV